MTPTLEEGEIYPEFTVNIRNVSNNLLASGYNTDSIRVAAAGFINGQTAEWAVGGTATFDSVFTYNGGNARFITYGFECLSDTFDVYISSVPDSLVIVGLGNSVNRTETVPQFEVHAYNFPQDGSAQLNTEYQGVVNLGKKSGAGAVGGTLTKPLVNGVATFDDVSFQYSDEYELIAYFIDVASPDTSSITVLPDVTGDWYFNRIDTLSEYVDRANWWSWWGSEFGYNGGPSRIPIWTDIGQQFDFDGSGRITEIALHAGFYDNVGSDEDSIAVSFYDAGVNQLVGVDQNPNSPASIFYVDSLAKHLLGTTYIREDSLQEVSTSELFNQHPIRWPLDNPIEVHGPFVVTIQFNYENGVNDTLVIQQSLVGDALGEGRNSRKVINNQNGFADGTWLPEYMALASTQHDYDFMIEPILEVDSFQIAPPVGFSTLGSESGLQVYPNPTSSVTILRGVSLTEVEAIAVRDVYGKEVDGLNVNSVSSDMIGLDLTNIPSGCYLLDLVSEDVRHALRVVKID